MTDTIDFLNDRDTIFSIDSDVSECVDTNNSSLNAEWNCAVEEIFSTPLLEPRGKAGRGRAITSHRLLTSDSIIESKRQKQEEKERKENEKKMRQERRKSTLGKGPQPKRGKK